MPYWCRGARIWGSSQTHDTPSPNPKSLGWFAQIPGMRALAGPGSGAFVTGPGRHPGSATTGEKMTGVRKDTRGQATLTLTTASEKPASTKNDGDAPLAEAARASWACWADSLDATKHAATSAPLAADEEAVAAGAIIKSVWLSADIDGNGGGQWWKNVAASHHSCDEPRRRRTSTWV